MAHLLLLNGPNLNLLGQREPAIYGGATLAEVDDFRLGPANDLRVDFEPRAREGNPPVLDCHDAVDDRLVRALIGADQRLLAFDHPELTDVGEEEIGGHSRLL